MLFRKGDLIEHWGLAELAASMIRVEEIEEIEEIEKAGIRVGLID
jgi:hypothetical protein